MNAHDKPELEGHCYVLLQGNWIHPIAHHRHDLVWYPERGMNLLDQHAYRPYVKSVVTENAWIIACYPREKVRVLDETGRWVFPDYQTYACSHNCITLQALGIRSTIPAMTLDGGKNIAEWAAEYGRRVALSSSRAKSS